MEVHRTVTGGTRAASVNSVGLLVPKRPPLMLGCLLVCDNYPPATHAARHSAGALTLRQIRDRCRAVPLEVGLNRISMFPLADNPLTGRSRHFHVQSQTRRARCFGAHCSHPCHDTARRPISHCGMAFAA